jgi:nitronate monooxygenase
MAGTARRTSPILEGLVAPIVQAPMAGGPSTPALSVAVARGGGLGFLAAGYLTVERLATDIATLRVDVERFGVNVFVGGASPADPAAVAAYAGCLRDESDRTGIELGEPRFDDDGFAEKIELLCTEPVAVVSFTFGIPPASVVERLQGLGSEVWLTVTSPQEAREATSAGADALVVQGVEAGGHRGVFADDGSQSDLTVLAALQLVGDATQLPLVAAGSIMTGAGLAAVLVGGARAGQVGTAYLRTPEAGTSEAQRDATTGDTPTVLTRAFSGRTARGIRNRFDEEYGRFAPRAYPEVHHLTAPLRAHARAVGDPDLLNLWAGQAHRLAGDVPAEELTRRLAQGARDAIAEWSARLA